MSLELERLLVRRAGLQEADLATQLEWIEQLAGAAEGAGLGQAGAEAALQLKAVVGAVVAFSRGPQGQAELLELELTVRTLTARALYGLYGSLADAYAALAVERTGEHRVLGEIAALFRAQQAAVADGKAEAADFATRLEALQQQASTDET